MVAPATVNNPRAILSMLVSFLERETRVVLYGRAALALGFSAAPEAFTVTRDVDAILPGAELAAIEADEQFWRALDRTNCALEPSGLYMTHLFVDEQVILSPDWLAKIVPLALPEMKHLRLYRPCVLDLVLTKMMRRDPQDLSDIEFLLGREPLTEGQLVDAFAGARCPDIDEIRMSFVVLQSMVLALARQAGGRPSQ